MFFFFFKAEDGIRDLTVTGVQTFALPISLFVGTTVALCSMQLFQTADAGRNRARLERSIRRDIARHAAGQGDVTRSEEHTSELQSQSNLVCRLLLEKKKKKKE